MNVLGVKNKDLWKYFWIFWNILEYLCKNRQILGKKWRRLAGFWIFLVIFDDFRQEVVVFWQVLTMFDRFWQAFACFSRRGKVKIGKMGKVLILKVGFWILNIFRQDYRIDWMYRIKIFGHRGRRGRRGFKPLSSRRTRRRRSWKLKERAKSRITQIFLTTHYTNITNIGKDNRINRIDSI